MGAEYYFSIKKKSNTLHYYLSLVFDTSTQLVVIIVFRGVL